VFPTAALYDIFFVEFTSGVDLISTVCFKGLLSWDFSFDRVPVTLTDR